MRRARVGFWSSLVAIGAFGGAVTSSAAGWSETFRIEDLAYGVPDAGDVDLFEHFRPDTGVFLNAFGWVLCALMIVAVSLSMALVQRRLHWSVAALVGLASGAAAALGVVLMFLQFPVVALMAGLGALAYAHAKRIAPAGDAHAALQGKPVRPTTATAIAVGAIAVVVVIAFAVWFLGGFR